ncbi:MAG TPA: sulfite exporter TauE/SafE family protein [Streptosporangiaceae bacterium]
MLGPVWTELVALAAAYVIAVIGTPAGISGAVLLLPFQVSVLGTPSPAVTPTNLLYNVVATPGALFRYWRQRQTGGRLAGVLIAGTVPGVIAGSVIRVELLPGGHLFDYVVAAVLLPIGVWLAVSRPPAKAAQEPAAAAAPPASRELRSAAGQRPGLGMRSAAWLIALSVVVGCVGGIYGIGGGSILAPVLIGTGRRPADVAPAALASTFVTSVAGVITFALLSLQHHGPVAPDWPTGIALGLGGLAGAYTGARIQSRLPEAAIRRLVGVLVIAIGARYALFA